MLTKILIATAVVLATASSSMAASKASRNDVYRTSGKYIGTDPDPTIRAQLAQDPAQGS